MLAYTNALYPLFGIFRLRTRQGEQWAGLVDRLSRLPVSDPQVMAFNLTMRRIRAAQNIEASACADPLCAVCAAQTVADFDGSEQELMALYSRALKEIHSTLDTMRTREVVPQHRAAIA